MRKMIDAKKRYFDYLEKQGKMPKMHDEEDDMMHMSDGGEVPEDYDYEMGHAEEYDSSGEPHTDDELEDEHPMEYMSRGGMVKRMSRGGKVPSSMFAKALRKNF